MIKEFFKYNWKGFIVSSILTLLGSILIFLKQNQINTDWGTFILWSPMVIVMLFIFSFGIYLFMFGGKKDE